MSEIDVAQEPDDEAEMLAMLKDLVEEIQGLGFRDGLGRPLEAVQAYRDAMAMLAVRGLLDR